MRWKIFQRIKFLFRHSSNSRKLSQQKLHNEVACVFTPYYASKNADWNQQQRTVGGILANRNSANHPYCFLFNQKEVQILTFFCLQSGHDLAGRFGRVIPLYRTLGPAGLRELLQRCTEFWRHQRGKFPPVKKWEPEIFLVLLKPEIVILTQFHILVLLVWANQGGSAWAKWGLWNSLMWGWAPRLQ